MATLTKARAKAVSRVERTNSEAKSKLSAAKTLEYEEPDDLCIDDISQEELDELENSKFDDPSMFESRKKMKQDTETDAKEAKDAKDTKEDADENSETQSEDELESSPAATQTNEAELCK